MLSLFPSISLSPLLLNSKLANSLTSRTRTTHTGKESTGSSVGVFVSHVEHDSEADRKGLKVSYNPQASEFLLTYLHPCRPGSE